MRVLVCGGRNYGCVPDHHIKYTPAYNTARKKAHDELCRFHEVLDALHSDLKFSVVIHGDSKGADRLAKKWAIQHDINHEPYPANWFPDGFGRLDRSAGPKRNQRMLDEGRPELVVAFPGGTGTADMLRRARAAGVKVVEGG